MLIVSSVLRVVYRVKVPIRYQTSRLRHVVETLFWKKTRGAAEMRSLQSVMLLESSFEKKKVMIVRLLKMMIPFS